MDCRLETPAVQPLVGEMSMAPFERFIDADAMGALFQARLPEFAEGKLSVARCDIRFARYKTFVRAASQRKSYLALCYELAVSDKAGSPLGTQLYYAKAFLDGRSLPQFTAAQQARLVAPRFGPALTHWADLDMILWAFPNDPALPQLTDLMDARGVLPFLPYESLAPSVQGPHDLAQVSASVIHYYPEERCTSRHFLKPKGDGAPELTLIAKSFSDNRGAALFRRMGRLFAETNRSDDVTVPRPLGYEPATRTLWLEEVPGRAALGYVMSKDRERWLAAIAKSLAALHRCHSLAAVSDRSADPLAEFDAKLAKLRDAFPGERQKLEALKQRLEKAAPRPNTVQSGFIHGDFHLRQLLVCREKIIVLDFDECGRGDPLQDLASFMVDLYFYDVAAADAEGMGELFLRAYQSQTGAAISMESLRWYLAVQFFTKAYRAYRQHLPDRDAQVSRLIGRAVAHAMAAAGDRGGVRHA